jgi:hypothetical protein
VSDFEDALGDVLEKDAELTGAEPIGFLHGVVDETGAVGTISLSRSDSLTYDRQVSILAALIAEVEANSDRSAEDVFRDLVERRNQMGSSGDGR